MATSDDWLPDNKFDLKGGSGERFGLPDAGKLSFKKDGANLKIDEIKDDENKGVSCDWNDVIPYAFVAGSTYTKVTGKVGSKLQDFTIELSTVVDSKGKQKKKLDCTIAASPARLASTPGLTWLKKLLKVLAIHSAVGDAGSWTAIEGG